MSAISPGAPSARSWHKALVLACLYSAAALQAPTQRFFPRKTVSHRPNSFFEGKNHGIDLDFLNPLTAHKANINTSGSTEVRHHSVKLSTQQVELLFTAGFIILIGGQMRIAMNNGWGEPLGTAGITISTTLLPMIKNLFNQETGRAGLTDHTVKIPISLLCGFIGMVGFDGIKKLNTQHVFSKQLVFAVAWGVCSGIGVQKVSSLLLAWLKRHKQQPNHDPLTQNAADVDAKKNSTKSTYESHSNSIQGPQRLDFSPHYPSINKTIVALLIITVLMRVPTSIEQKNPNSICNGVKLIFISILPAIAQYRKGSLKTETPLRLLSEFDAILTAQLVSRLALHLTGSTAGHLGTTALLGIFVWGIGIGLISNWVATHLKGALDTFKQQHEANYHRSNCSF